LAVGVCFAVGALPAWNTQRLAKPMAHALATEHGVRVFAWNASEPSLVFYAGRRIAEGMDQQSALRMDTGELRCMVAQADLPALQQALPGEWRVEATWRGWYRLRFAPAEMLLVRRLPARSMAAVPQAPTPR
jgi:hypothetical protein